MKKRLDNLLIYLKLTDNRSKADNLIKLNKVIVNGKIINKSGTIINFSPLTKIKIINDRNYVSRSAYKLESVAPKLKLNFKGKVILDVGSSTGGFTQYALINGAARVIAVEKGTDQMDPKIKNNAKVELHEKTDVINFNTSEKVDIVLIDVSFMSIRPVLLHIYKLIEKNVQIVAMVKPQFEAHLSSYKHKGVIKNEKIRRDILTQFENWSKQKFVIKNKADSLISGAKGNRERFYLLKIIT